MRIHRHPGLPHTRMPNSAARDTRLSWKARGLLAFILSHTDEGWTIDADWLATQGPDGRSAILAGLKELVAHGYMVRRRVRADRGRWVTEVDVYDHPPHVDNPGDTTVDNNGHNGNNNTQTTPPTSGFPTSDNLMSDPAPQPTKPQVAPKAGFPTSDPPTSDRPTVGEPAAIRRPSRRRSDQRSQTQRSQTITEILTAAGATTPAEIDACITQLRTDHPDVQHPAAYLATMHANGDLTPYVTTILTRHRTAAARAKLEAAYRNGWHCPRCRNRQRASTTVCRQCGEGHRPLRSVS